MELVWGEIGVQIRPHETGMALVFLPDGRNLHPMGDRAEVYYADTPEGTAHAQRVATKYLLECYSDPAGVQAAYESGQSRTRKSLLAHNRYVIPLYSLAWAHYAADEGSHGKFRPPYEQAMHRPRGASMRMGPAWLDVPCDPRAPTHSTWLSYVWYCADVWMSCRCCVGGVVAGPSLRLKGPLRCGACGSAQKDHEEQEVTSETLFDQNTHLNAAIFYSLHADWCCAACGHTGPAEWDMECAHCEQPTPTSVEDVVTLVTKENSSRAAYTFSLYVPENGPTLQNWGTVRAATPAFFADALPENLRYVGADFLPEFSPLTSGQFLTLSPEEQLAFFGISIIGQGAGSYVEV